jgi:hypothetical protein
MITPREMLRDYMTVLNILMQNPDAKFADVVGTSVTLKSTATQEDVSEQEQARVTPQKTKYTANDIEF